MESVLTKAGKIRSLVKELKTKYGDDDGAKKFFAQPFAFSHEASLVLITCAHQEKQVPSPSGLPRCCEQLKKEIANLDAEYDGCQDVWSKGEARGFFTEALLDWTGVAILYICSINLYVRYI